MTRNKVMKIGLKEVKTVSKNSNRRRKHCAIQGVLYRASKLGNLKIG